MNFDPIVNGKLFVGDVGQSAREEIDIVTSGANYGWDCFEGDISHSTTANCSATFTPPEVAHGRTDAQAITGGAVYRGLSIPGVQGFYIYGDFLTEKFFAFDTANLSAPAQQIPQLNAPVAAFGQDRAGEIYAVTFGSPSIQKIVYSGVGSGLGSLAFTDAFPGRSFNNPVKLVQHPTDANRWYVVEQGGLVRTFLATNTAAPTTAADVDALVNLGTAEEQGLLGMAFDPGFATSGEVYLTYTDDGAGAVRLARWVSANNGLTFAPDTNPIVLSTPHPLNNHNGSDIMFGRDGFLYYSMGDGGGSDDPDNNGQNSGALLGKILRLDVNGQVPTGKTYAIPGTNPFATNAQCNTGHR
jgi:glucose/arabinose dehydrogenase